AARIAVMTAVRAAAVRIQRPLERHPFDAVQLRSAGDFLVARLIGAALRLGQRSGAAGANGPRDVARGRLGSAQIEKEWIRRHGRGPTRSAFAAAHTAKTQIRFY